MSPGLRLDSVSGLAPPALLEAEDFWLVVWAECCLSDMSELFIFPFISVF